MKQISKVVGCVLGVGLLLVVLGAIPAAAAPCLVPSSAYPTIQAAVNDVTCTTINVAAGTYTEHVTIARDVTIRGEGQESTVVNRIGLLPGSGGVFTINSGTVTIKGVTIQNGVVFGGGGGISNSGTLTVQESTFPGNGAEVGGGIYNGGTLTVQNSTIDGNSVLDAGGGIFNSGGTVTLTHVTFENNTPNDCTGCP